MPKRRTTILGLGALAMGSGAAFTSAAFQDQVTPGADFRVVVEEDLRVEPGAAFRDEQGDFAPPDDEFFNGDNESLFPGIDQSGLEDVPVDDLPAAAANDADNDDLELEVGTLNGSSHTFTDFIQITNDGQTDQDVGIRFNEFGTDTAGDQDEKGGDVSESDVVDVYKFDSSGRISADSVGAGQDATVDDQNVPNFVNVSAGQTVQVDLTVDTTGTVEDAIINAANVGQDPFGGELDTVQLVRELRVGTEGGGS